HEARAVTTRAPPPDPARRSDVAATTSATRTPCTLRQPPELAHEPEPVEDRLALVAGPGPPVRIEAVAPPGDRELARLARADRRARRTDAIRRQDGRERRRHANLPVRVEDERVLVVEATPARREVVGLDPQLARELGEARRPAELDEAAVGQVPELAVALDHCPSSATVTASPVTRPSRVVARSTGTRCRSGTRESRTTSHQPSSGRRPRTNRRRYACG